MPTARQKGRTGYGRVVLKLSGECFCGEGSKGFDAERVAFLAGEIGRAYEHCPQMAVVTGGGNIIRGATGGALLPDRLSADHAGMTATVVNALVLSGALSQAGIPCAVRGAFSVANMVREFDAREGRDILSAGCVLLLCGGTGNPFFSTDTASALRAAELEAEAVLKATKVDGLYSSDPKTHPNAQRYERLTHAEVITKRLAAMDLAAVWLCMEQQTPILVFRYDEPGNLERAVKGERLGTLVSSFDNSG